MIILWFQSMYLAFLILVFRLVDKFQSTIYNNEKQILR